MRADIKKVINVKTQHFIFTIDLSHHRYKSSPCILRIGVKWQSLLGVLITVPKLKQVFWQELAMVCRRYSGLKNSQGGKIRRKRKPLIPSYNYIAPEQSWINKFPLDRRLLIENLIPRFKQLLMASALPHWIVTQIISTFLAAIARTFSEEEAIDLGRRFLIATIDAFQNARQNFLEMRKYENFYSFVFNLLQQSFLSENYPISVSKSLVAYKIPVTFIRDVYALHSNNNAAREELWQWFLEDKDFFEEKFDKFWLDRGYKKSEIESFKEAVIPVISPDEDHMLEQDIPEQKEELLQTPVSDAYCYPEINSTPVTAPVSSPDDSLTSNSSSSPYFYPSSPVYYVPEYQLTPPVPQYPVPMQFFDPSGAGFIVDLAPSLLRPNMPQMRFASMEEPKSYETSTETSATILGTMQASFSSNQQGFLTGRNKAYAQSVVESDYYQYRH